MSGRVLIVESIPANRALLKAKLEAAYYDVQMTGNAAEATYLARSEQPDLILLSACLAGDEGLTVCKMLKSARETLHIPVIVITGEGGADAQRSFAAGADDVLVRPYDDLTLKTRLRNLVRMKLMLDELRLRDDTARGMGILPDAAPQSGFAEDMASEILLLPRTSADASAWKRHMKGGGMAPVFAWSEAEAVALAMSGQVQVCAVPQRLADGSDGMRLISHLRAQNETRHLGIIFIADDECADGVEQALDLGASDYIAAPMNLGELVGRVRCQLRRKLISDQLRANLRDGIRASVTDPLTRLYNRRYAETHLLGLLGRVKDGAAPFAVMMLDLDHFKQVNDRYGHLAGDEVLTQTAARLTTSVRNVDLVARFGGEEFFIVMPEASLEGAVHVAERVRYAIEAEPFSLEDGRRVNVTMSVGVALVDPDQCDPILDVTKRADQALYASKAAGRNCVRQQDAAA